MRRRLLAVLLSLGLWSGGAEAADYVVGVEELDYYPAYAWKDGTYTGAAREILDAFAADEGITLEYRALPVNRLYAGLLGGGIDFKFPDNPNWNPSAKADAEVIYSTSVIDYIDGVMVRPDQVGKGPDALTSLGTVTGFTPFSWLDRIADGRTALNENGQIESLLRQVMAGRIQGAYVNVSVSSYLVGTEMNKPGGLVFDPGLPHNRDSYRLSTVTHPDVVARLDAWLSKNAGRVRQIKDRLGAEAGLSGS